MSSNSYAPPREQNEPLPSDGNMRREVWKLGFIFGTMYFVQGLTEPGDGLLNQPIMHLLESWGRSDKYITRFMAWLYLPWVLKPVFGLITDFVPLAGFRRKSYLFLSSAVAIAGFTTAYLLDFQSGDETLLFICLLLPTMAVAFGDVVNDALMVERSQPLGLTGRMQSIQWSCLYGATIVTGMVGGWLSGHDQYALTFALCALCSLPILALSLGVGEPAPATTEITFRPLMAELWQAIASRRILGVSAFLFCWSFNPFSTSVLYLYMTKPEGLNLTEQFRGNTVSIQALGAIAACATYGLYCRRVSMRVLMHLSILLGVLSTLAYWFMVGEKSAIVVSAAVGFTYMAATIIQLDLAARICPPRVAGTLFAVLMSLSNLAVSLSAWLGGGWYESGIERWGATTSFNVLVAAGALFTAACWLIVPRCDLNQ